MKTISNNKFGLGTSRYNLLDAIAVAKTVLSQRLSYGNQTKKFEQEFAKYINLTYAIFTNSGTSSLLIALQALKEKYGWKDGDEVLVPSVTFVATINIVYQAGLKPVLVDIDKTLNINPALIGEKITKKTRCIIPVYLAGQKPDMATIKYIADEYNLRILSDACESVLSDCFSDIICYSTYMSHLVTTGVGGLACTNDTELNDIMRSLANHGRDPYYFQLDDNQKQKEKLIDSRFRFVRKGYSFRATELEATLGLRQLKKLERILDKRSENTNYFLDNLPSGVTAQKREFISTPMLQPLFSTKRDELVLHLENNGIQTRPLLPIISQPCYKFSFKDYPVAEYCEKNGFYICLHQDLNKKDLDYIIKTINDFNSISS